MKTAPLLSTFARPEVFGFKYSGFCCLRAVPNNEKESSDNFHFISIAGKTKAILQIKPIWQ